MKNYMRGQAALILILLAAAALIFLAITLNWGRIAQVKSLSTIASDEAATQLASDAASYGEMEKQTYLVNENIKTSLDGVLLSVLILIISIILAVIPATAPAAGWALGLAIAGMVMTFVSIVLQLVWINPMISALWNKLQMNQPQYQQFYEQGLSTAFQSSVTDQVNITDYFDWNANGVFGKNASGFARDTVGRFALYYTDRLKMLNQPDIPQVAYFYDQLAELMNGETCGQNQSDNYNYGNPVDAGCQAAGVMPFSSPPCTPTSSCTTPDINCVLNPIDPVCQEKIPNGFQLNDACTDSNPLSPTYNPYCDPCCQPLNVPNPLYCAPSTTSSTSSSSSSSSTACTGTTSTGAACNCNPLVSQYLSLRPSNCDQSAIPAQCLVNNPYNAAAGGPYSLIYDPSFQEYNNKLSFLDQFGRDQQIPPAAPPPGQTPVMSPNVMTPSTVTPSLEFPNGVYPFFWLMNDYSPEVDNIDPTTTPLTSAQYHWCVAGGSVPAAPAAPAGFADLAQLTLPYVCTGQDCCVNHILNSLTSNGSASSSPITITLISGPVINMTTPATSVSYVATGSSVTITATASTTSPVTIAQVALYDAKGLITSCPADTCSVTESNVPVGVYTAYGVATDSNGISSTSATVTINIIDPPTVSITVAPTGALTGGSSATITASAATTGTGDAISSVAFYNGTTLLGTVTSSPYSYVWTVPATGTSYSLTAVATDTYGLSTTSTAVTGTAS